MCRIMYKAEDIRQNNVRRAQRGGYYSGEYRSRVHYAKDTTLLRCATHVILPKTLYTKTRHSRILGEIYRKWLPRVFGRQLETSHGKDCAFLFGVQLVKFQK